jgi:hypothetical protein
MKKNIVIILIIIFVIVLVSGISVFSKSDKNNSKEKSELIYSKASNTIADTNLIANREVIVENTTDSYGNVTHIINSTNVTDDDEDLQNEDAYFDENGVEIEVLEDSISNSGCTIKITNIGGNPGEWGSKYIIEKYDNNEWITVNPINMPIFDETLYYSDKSYYTTQINWSKFYGELDEGIYRIGKYDKNSKCYYSESFNIK